MKRLFLITLVALLASSTLIGCGVAQEDYDRVFNDLTAAQDRIQILETDLAAAQSELVATNAAYDSLQADHDDLNTLVEEWKDKLESASVYKQVIVELITPAITGIALTETTTIDKVKSIVDGAEDETLKQKFDDWANAPDDKLLVADLLVYAFLRVEELVF